MAAGRPSIFRPTARRAAHARAIVGAPGGGACSSHMPPRRPHSARRRVRRANGCRGAALCYSGRARCYSGTARLFLRWARFHFGWAKSGQCPPGYSWLLRAGYFGTRAAVASLRRAVRLPQLPTSVEQWNGASRKTKQPGGGPKTKRPAGGAEGAGGAGGRSGVAGGRWAGRLPSLLAVPGGEVLLGRVPAE